MSSTRSSYATSTTTASNSILIRKGLFVSLHELGQSTVENRADLAEFGKVEASFSAFVLADERLICLQSDGDFILSKTRRNPQFTQEVLQDGLFATVSDFFTLSDCEEMPVLPN